MVPRRPSVIRVSAALAAVALAAACGDGSTGPAPPVTVPNRAPGAVGTIPGLTLTVGDTESVDVSSYFNDPDGDALSYAATSSDTEVATASVSGSTVTVTGVAKGAATVTVTASDAGGLAAQQGFEVTVPNGAPEAVGTIPDLTLSAGDTEGVDVSSYFSDPDGDALSYGAASSDAEVATVSVSGSTVTVTGVAEGTATVTVTASDPEGLTATQDFAVTAEGPRPQASLSVIALASPEGGLATLEVVFTGPPRESPVIVSYRLGIDDDPGTADADALDYADVASGAVEIGTEANEAVIEITIHDDDNIEPVREVFTVTLDAAAEGAGYELGSVTSAVVTIEEGVCDRTPQVRDEIMRQAGVAGCTETEDRHLAGIQRLELDPTPNVNGIPERATITAVREGDFSGLSNLEHLSLHRNALTELPPDVFSGLSNLEHLSLYRNAFTELPSGVFSGLSRLGILGLSGNAFTELPPHIFSGLSSLEHLSLHSNQLAELPPGVFSGLSNLERLALSTNALTELPPDVFSGLSNLEHLSLDSNAFTELPPGVFSGLSNLEHLSLDSNALTELPPAVFSGLSSLRYLGLSNALTELPSGIFSGLSSLERLELDSNQLTKFTPGIFSGLSSLEHLSLGSNALTELPPGFFSGLSSLEHLSLHRNAFTELPPDIFSGLSSLEHLNLEGNALTELPPDFFSGLSSLEYLSLGSNALTELPPGVFSGLSNLESLSLGGNPGAPFMLTLELARTDSDDPVSPGPVTLEARLAEGAPFAMTIPLSARGGTLSTESVSLAAGATVSTGATLRPAGSGAVSVAGGPIPVVCVARSTSGPACTGVDFIAGGPLVVANPSTVTLSVPAAYLTQGAQNLDGGVPLIAGRQALLRVFPTADELSTFRPEGQATFFAHGREVYRASLKPPALGIPTEVEVGESHLGQSFNVRIPGHVLQPGLEMVVQLDPGGTLPLKPGSRTRFPALGRLALDVRNVPRMHLTIVPVLYHTEANRSTNPQIEAATRDLTTTDSYGTLPYTRDILPIGDLNVKLREPYYTFADTTGSADSVLRGAYQILNEIEMLRHLEAGEDEYYHGVYARPNTERSDRRCDPQCWPGGIARISGHASVSGAISAVSAAFSHELGHNLSLPHAPCGDVRDFDPDFPYPDGSIGVWGHRFKPGAETGVGRLLHPDVYKDLMSYCSPSWISDYNFTKALTFRLASSPAAFRQPLVASQTTSTLLLWGGVQDGDLRLEPTFVYDARVKLPEAPGPYRLTGLDAQGRRLFSLSFTPDELDHGGSNFLFAVPFEPEWTEDLHRVTLTGPQGSTTLDRDTGGRAALIIDRASGLVRTIAREWSDATLPAAMPANTQVEVIQGLPRR